MVNVWWWYFEFWSILVGGKVKVNVVNWGWNIWGLVGINLVVVGCKFFVGFDEVELDIWKYCFFYVDLFFLFLGKVLNMRFFIWEGVKVVVVGCKFCFWFKMESLSILLVIVLFDENVWEGC